MDIVEFVLNLFSVRICVLRNIMFAQLGQITSRQGGHSLEKPFLFYVDELNTTTTKRVNPNCKGFTGSLNVDICITRLDEYCSFVSQYTVVTARVNNNEEDILR